MQSVGHEEFMNYVIQNFSMYVVKLIIKHSNLV